MALTALQLQAGIDQLTMNRAQGVRRVRDSNGDMVDFASDAEMASAIASLRRELAALVNPPVSTIRFHTRKL